MRTITFAALAIAACLTLTGTATAETQSNAILNRLEVQQLVARAEPADNARLAAHFLALEARYTAEAKKHTSMAQSFVGNPSRNFGSGMSVHCKRLADLNTESAKTVGELAAYHQKLAAGASVMPPKDAARFQGGAGASEPTEKELDALAAKAVTPADHRALQEYFLTLAKGYRTAVDEHVALAQTYRGTKIAQAATFQDHLAQTARDSAKEATEAAEMHKQLANTGR